MPVLNKTCCCCTLRTGTFIIGICGGIVHGITIFTLLILMFTGVGDPLIPVIFIMAIGMFCLRACLIAAGQKNNPKLLLPWLGISVVKFNLMNAALMYVLCSSIIDYRAHVTSALMFIFIIIANAFYVYPWLIVCAYYHELKKINEVNNRIVNAC